MCVDKKLGRPEERSDSLDLQGPAALWFLWPASQHTRLLFWSVEPKVRMFT